MPKDIIFFPETAQYPQVWGYQACNPVYLLVGNEGLEPSRLSAHDPKSCLSANSSTSPQTHDYKRQKIPRQRMHDVKQENWRNNATAG